MENDYKNRVREALEIYSQKLLSRRQGPTRHNEKPEKQVQDDCLKWMRSQNWSVAIYEAKSTMGIDGRWRQQGMKQGTVDCLGNLPDGIGCAIEFKAPGKISSLRDKQREFLMSKINTNCFACVVDSVDKLIKIHSDWLEMRKENLQLAQEYLFSILPKKKTRLDTEPLFPEE